METESNIGHLWGAVCKKNYLEQICDIFSYLEIIKTARKFKKNVLGTSWFINNFDREMNYI